MRRFLRPTDFLDDEDDTNIATAATAAVDKNTGATGAEREILDALGSFYRGLTTGDREAIDRVCAPSGAGEVTEVLGQGGRIDPWEACLAEGARPAGMVVTGADVTLVSPEEAYTTCLEFPADTGLDAGAASLLAVQRFALVDGEWKLGLHQTIPWSLDAPAQGTLRCDRRGCVALTRGEDRRTFGGLIG